MKFAVIKAGGSQHLVSEGEEIEINKIEGEKGNSVTFDQVMLLVEEKKVHIGKPLVEKAMVTAKIIDQIKGEKIRIAKFRAKSRYRRVQGFRPQLTKVKIEEISLSTT